jgi:hypothetical protein
MSCVVNLTDVKSCIFKKFFLITFVVTIVSVFDNFTPNFTQPETFTFVNNIVINYLSSKKLLCKRML